MSERSGALRTVPLTRALLGLALIGPPLWLGGVRPETVGALALVVAVLFLRLAGGKRERLRIPGGLWIPVLGATTCFLQWAGRVWAYWSWRIDQQIFDSPPKRRGFPGFSVVGKIGPRHQQC